MTTSFNNFPTKSTWSGPLNNGQPSVNFNNPQATDIDAANWNPCSASASSLTQVAFQVFLQYKLTTQSITQYTPCWDINRSAAPTCSYNHITKLLNIVFPATIIDNTGCVQIVNMTAALTNPNVVNGRQIKTSAHKLTNNSFNVRVNFTGSLPGSTLVDIFIL